jgi:hypothetical protein
MTTASKFEWPTNDLVWAIRDYKLVIGKIDYTENKITSLVSSEIESNYLIQIHYEAKSTKFIAGDLTDVADYPSQFHDGVMNKVLEQLWIKKGDVNRAAYYKNEYRECVMMAKRFVNESKDGSNFHIAQHSM